MSSIVEVVGLADIKCIAEARVHIAPWIITPPRRRIRAAISYTGLCVDLATLAVIARVHAKRNRLNPTNTVQ
jgi:hypothetical protein